MCDQVRSIDKKDRLIKKLGTLDSKTFREVEEKLLEVLLLTKSLSNKQLLNELARRIKEKAID
jgi:PemK-like, MazF-like toxin of type II toxin-antitoxin system